MFYKLGIPLLIFSTFSLAGDDVKKLESFKANFSQTIKSSSKTAIEYKGQVFIKSSGKILWKYKTPIQKNVYINNNLAVVDEPELEQAVFTQLESEINIIKLLNNSEKIDNNTYKSSIEGVDYLIKVTEEKIDSITYKDKLDNDVEINFSNVVQNQTIYDDIFKFSPPANYDIIRK